jgi:segregation and condensation protein B
VSGIESGDERGTVDAAEGLAEEPPRPEIDPALLRAVAEVAEPEGEPSEAAAEEASDAGGDVEPVLPDVALTTKIEALLFAAPEPLSVRRLRALLGVEDATEIREAVEALMTEYGAAGRAFQVAELAGGFQLRTRPDLAPVVDRLRRKRTEDKLSPAAMETLAIVAYRQPVLRADVEKIRGVACGEVLRSLMERDLVRVAGRAELPGAPLLYGTTARFLEVFGLRNLRDLPRTS